MDVEHDRRVSGVFDAWAQQGRGDRMERGHRPTAGRVLEDVPVTREDRFLDLGTGNGWAARDAVTRGARVVVGVDVAPRMLRLARGRGVGGSFARASFERLPFRDDAFTRAFSVEALYYAGDLLASLREVRRVLAPGGSLDAVVDYYEENPDSHDWPALTGVRMHRLAEAEWARAFEDAGFRGVRTARVRTPEGTGDAWQWRHGSLHVHGRA